MVVINRRHDAVTVQFQALPLLRDGFHVVCRSASACTTQLQPYVPASRVSNTRHRQQRNILIFVRGRNELCPGFA